MRRIALCFLFFIKGVLGFALGMYESYSFDKVTIEKEWGDISIRLNGSTNKLKGKTVEGSPYEIIFLFTTKGNTYKNAEILYIKTIFKDLEEGKFPIHTEESNFSLNNNGNSFEKFSDNEFIVSIWGYPFRTRHENQKLKFRIKLTSNDNVIEEDIIVDLKLLFKKRLGIHFLERIKDV